jgi:hypothetical protein
VSGTRSGLATLFALLVAAPFAGADDKDACASASEQAQQLRSRGKLIEARDQLLACSRRACPAVVKEDCERILTDVEASIPSVVVNARDPDNKDTVAVRVLADGAPLAETLTGLAIPLDPGAHTLRFELAGAKVVEQRVVVHEAEKNRVITVAFESLTPKPPRVVEPPRLPIDSHRETTSRVPSPFAYVFATLGAVGIGAFGYFQLRALFDASHLRSTCAPHCPQSDVDGVSTEVVGAHVSLVLAVVFSGAATWFFLKSPSSASVGATSFSVGPGSVLLRTTF